MTFRERAFYEHIELLRGLLARAVGDVRDESLRATIQGVLGDIEKRAPTQARVPQVRSLVVPYSDLSASAGGT